MTRWLLLVTGVSACGSKHPPDVVGPPLGSSTQSAGADPSIPPPDSAGTPPDNQAAGSDKKMPFDLGDAGTH